LYYAAALSNSKLTVTSHSSAQILSTDSSDTRCQSHFASTKFLEREECYEANYLYAS